MRLYADQTAYEAYTQGAAPANVDVLLRLASRVVDTLLIGRQYDVDAAGMPTNADDAQALSDAACAIAQEADATGAAVAGGAHDWDSVGIGNVSLSGRKLADGAVAVAGLTVPPAALVSLADVGTRSVVVWL